jgi:hypothetical protein
MGGELGEGTRSCRLRDERAGDRVAGAEQTEVRGITRWKNYEVCLEVRWC